MGGGAATAAAPPEKDEVTTEIVQAVPLNPLHATSTHAGKAETNVTAFPLA